MDKTRDPVSSKIWPYSTCAISVRRKGQILLVAGSLVLSTTYCLSGEFSNRVNWAKSHWVKWNWVNCPETISTFSSSHI